MSKRRRLNINMKKASAPLLDIIIAVYGRFDLLKECLESIPSAAQDVSYQVTLIDNNSPNKEEADAFYARLDKGKHRVIHNKENRGFPKACNQGARNSQSPLLFFLNSDVILFDGAIKHMVMDMDDPAMGIVGMKLLFPPETPSGPADRIQHVGLYTDINGLFNHLFIGWSPDNPKVLAVREVLAVTGAALMTRRELYVKLGGFDEAFGMGTYEDVDLCMKVRKSGRNIIVEQKAEGYHYTNATAREYQVPFPLMQNKSIFESRWAGQYPWTEMLHV